MGDSSYARSPLRALAASCLSGTWQRVVVAFPDVALLPAVCGAMAVYCLGVGNRAACASVVPHSVTLYGLTR